MPKNIKSQPDLRAHRRHLTGGGRGLIATWTPHAVGPENEHTGENQGTMTKLKLIQGPNKWHQEVKL